MTAPHVYEGEIRSLVLSLKYANDRRLARRLAADVTAHAVKRSVVADMVTWIPTTRRKLRRRGVDPAELIAVEVARNLGIPCRRLLVRVREVSQTGQSRRVRLSQVGFRARRPSDVSSVLVVDDVVTTGASMRAATRALRSAGVQHVQCIAVAVTPPRSW